MKPTQQSTCKAVTSCICPYFSIIVLNDKEEPNLQAANLVGAVNHQSQVQAGMEICGLQNA